jgi:hypothetical protein
MSDFASNLASGLLGALIGSFTAIYAVRHSVVLQCEADLRKLLIAQRMAIRMMGTIDAQKKQQEDFLPIFQAYENLRSVYGPVRRKRLDKCWREYRGNHEDFIALFGIVTTRRTDTSIEATSRSFDREEIIANIDQLLKCVKY